MPLQPDTHARVPCHEGNYGMFNLLSGAPRAEEKEKAADEATK